jgi:hypothetical protein
VLMPETAPHFDDALQPGEHQIGLAGKMSIWRP